MAVTQEFTVLMEVGLARSEKSAGHSPTAE